MIREVLKYLSAKYFFKDYAGSVKNFTHKMRGIDGNGKPINFSKEDKRQIISGLKKMLKDIIQNIKND